MIGKNGLKLDVATKSRIQTMAPFLLSKTFLFGLVSACLLAWGILCGAAQGTSRLTQSLEPQRVYRIAVPSNAQWTDTGYDVQQSQEIHFRASGGISLQVGNPMAYCGPDGYDLRTLQQPLQDNNIGALIGKVVLLISIDIDEETGEETRNEIEELFYIGTDQKVSMPLDGRLFLGINEDVVGDNSGQFVVNIRLTPGDAEAISD